MAFNVRFYFGPGAMTRSWILVTVSAFVSRASQALVVIDNHAASGPMTPMLPTPDPSGRLFPGCMCPMPMAGLDGSQGTRQHRRRTAYKVDYSGVAPGEVEVLTVDVGLANRVRCDNASIAEEVARLLKIPVKRVAVTPWSWTLPDPPQTNYLAFLQEDHERCDCQGESGHLQGYRKVETSTDGWMVGPGTSVMTVSQYQAVQGVHLKCSDGLGLTAISPNECPANANLVKCDTAAGGELCDGDVQGCGTDTGLDNCGGKDIYRKAKAATLSPNLIVTPPSSRVQMLTRDPCLVYLLRDMTPHFRRKIALMLGVPEDKVIVDPPPVRGTVGLLQLDTMVNSETHARQVPVLGMQQCNLVELDEMVKHLSLISGVSVPAPAPAPANHLGGAPAPGSQPLVYTVASPNSFNETNSTNATNASTQIVSLVMKLGSIDYDLLAQSLPLVSSLTAMSKAAIGEAGHIPESAVKIAMYPGSVVIEAQIIPPPGTAPEAVHAFLNGTVCNATVDRLANMTALKSTLDGTLDCTVLSLTVEDPPPVAEESQANRPWIAFWSISVLPPFAQDGAWRLLKQVNEPGTALAKLLPMTLARIPGLKDRSLLEPNAAIEIANETRLPPPEDSAVGFGMPNPLNEQVALNTQMERMKREKETKTLIIKEKSALDMKRARETLQSAELLAGQITQAKAKFTRAARAHAEAVRAAPTVEVPDIVPSDLLDDPILGGESPYPWRDQLKRFSLAQEASVQQHPQQQHKAFLSQQPIKNP